eukprot:TRINITY_DN9203_c0_g1_i5.p1 TRINITY_DN9203_c0_g1~~TRINITY_DN9203_c0_g1_i5.p1  ORF type:complete len:122 (+),score=16.18 TRINITY_DN9203_c0_g1_i5:286-651(+)
MIHLICIWCRIFLSKKSAHVVLKMIAHDILHHRMFEYTKQNQKALVLVNGKEVGLWYSPRQAKQFNLADDEIWIPRSFFDGLPKIDIEIRPIYTAPGDREGQSDIWTAYKFWAFCEIESNS